MGFIERDILEFDWLLHARLSHETQMVLHRTLWDFCWRKMELSWREKLKRLCERDWRQREGERGKDGEWERERGRAVASCFAGILRLDCSVVG
ncbi:hypothetical protein HAX54_047399, partial [Datura stramonium]|nr:hypothetical protein [Datura stramonium]